LNPAGVTVAKVLGLDATADRKRIKKMIEAWLKSGALKRSSCWTQSAWNAPVWR